MGSLDWLKEQWERNRLVAAVAAVLLILGLLWLFSNTDFMEWMGKNWLWLMAGGAVLLYLYNSKNKSIVSRKDPGKVFQEICAASPFFTKRRIDWLSVQGDGLWVRTEGEIYLFKFRLPGTNTTVWARAESGALGTRLLDVWEEPLTRGRERELLKTEPTIEEIRDKIKKNEVIEKVKKEGEEE